MRDQLKHFTEDAIPYKNYFKKLKTDAPNF